MSEIKVIRTFELFTFGDDIGFYVRDSKETGISAWGETAAEALKEFSIAYEGYIECLKDNGREL